jgi:hypothetical protein
VPGFEVGTVKRAGTAEAMAPSRRTVGVSRVPGLRYSVSRSWYEGTRREPSSSSSAKVSVEMDERPSACPSTEVRRMSPSPSPAVQRPMTYQGVSVPSE